jgi:hypothetical protein
MAWWKGYLLDCYCISSFWAEVIKELCNSLFAVRVGTEWVDDPYLAEKHCRGDGSRLWVAGDEFNILNTATLKILLNQHVKL